jgi:4-azaleucine resistance transporter AzlC
VSAGRATALSPWALSAPVAFGYVPLGTVYGFLWVQAGGEAWLAVLASVLVYAGAAQFMMVPMLAAGVPLGAIAAATLIINLRHVFYGLSLLQRLPPGRVLRAYLSFALTDETYSVLTTLPADTPPRRLVAVAALNQGWWVLGSALGAVLGSGAKVPLQGLDFALCALFAVLATEQWRARSTAAPLWWALLAYGLALWVWPAQALALSIAACVAVGAAWPESAVISGEAR